MHVHQSTSSTLAKFDVLTQASASGRKVLNIEYQAVPNMSCIILGIHALPRGGAGKYHFDRFYNKRLD